MRVCLVCEGSYPYVAGGVSEWVQMLCSNTPNVEYVIWSIATTSEEMPEYKYALPGNVKEVVTVYLGEENFSRSHKRVHISQRERKVLRRFIGGEPESLSWASILEFVDNNQKNPVDVLMSKGFYEICLEEYQKTSCTEGFKEYLQSFREMYLSLLHLLSQEIPQADLYHSLATGYAGILASAASYREKKPMILTEHSIYSREREEDIIRADWIKSEFKELWIKFFRKLSIITYSQASLVISMYESNKMLQIENGCLESKIQIIPNGVDAVAFSNLENRNLLKEEGFHIGAIMRVVPGNDIKTLLFAFDRALEKNPDLQLWIMGECTEEPDYYEECLELVRKLEIRNVTFLGHVNVKDYLPEMDLLLLSGINTGQSLAMLEGMAAAKPFICTNVGDCKGLIEGKVGDDFGKAGYLVPVMDPRTMAETIVQCAKDKNKLQEMGEIARKRVVKYYRKNDFLSRYKSIYGLYGGNKEWQE